MKQINRDVIDEILRLSGKYHKETKVIETFYFSESKREDYDKTNPNFFSDCIKDCYDSIMMLDAQMIFDTMVEVKDEHFDEYAIFAGLLPNKSIFNKAMTIFDKENQKEDEANLLIALKLYIRRTKNGSEDIKRLVESLIPLLNELEIKEDLSK